VNGTNSNADSVDAEFDQILATINTGLVHKDGTVAMTGALTLPGPPTVNLHAATKAYVDSLIGAPSVAGFMGVWAGAVAPGGWLLCDGAAVNRVTYAALFAVIGTNHGAGDGSTTFNVPDMRGRTAIGAGLGAGLTSRVVGTKMGHELLQSHAHGQTLTAANAGGVYTWPTISQAPGVYAQVATATNTALAGGGSGENMQPSTVVTYVIKT